MCHLNINSRRLEVLSRQNLGFGRTAGAGSEERKSALRILNDGSARSQWIRTGLLLLLRYVSEVYPDFLRSCLSPLAKAVATLGSWLMFDDAVCPCEEGSLNGS